MSHPTPLIRPAQENDAPAIAAIYAPYVRNTPVSFEEEPPSATLMAERIMATLPTHPWLVAEQAGQIVGYAYAGKHSQRAAYRWTVDATVYVSEHQRRTGIGRRLYAVLLETLRQQGFRSAFAEIVLPNPGSIRLHEAMGFEHLGIHKDIGHKLGRWHDIGYWRLGLSNDTAAPTEPLPFKDLKPTAAFTTMAFNTVK